MKGTTFCMGLAWLLATMPLGFAQQVEVIYHNGAILTMAGPTPRYVEALAVEDGKIAFGGSKR